MGLIKFLTRINEKTKMVEVEVTEPPVGQRSGSDKSDFYVYEWFIVETGEVFYIGKGRGDRYKARHERAKEAEMIRDMYETDIRFLGENLAEEEALELETQEMLRILNETEDVLANRVIPFLAKRENGYRRSPKTPQLEFEKTPVFYAAEIDEHYFGVQPCPFDAIDADNLKKLYFVEKKVLPYEMDSLYHGDPQPYYDKVCSWLNANGCSIVKTKYAKSVTAWVYVGDDDIHNYKIDQTAAEERLGRKVPVYHLLDLWKYCKENPLL